MKSILYISAILLLFTVSNTFAQVAGITSSNLPLVVINTNGQVIQDAGKITATMKLIYNGAGTVNKPTDSGNIYNGNIGIEYQGGNAKPNEQNSYGFELRDGSGGNLNMPLLGMPEENDWILLGNFNDKTFARTALAFQLFRKLGHYAPRTKMVEVIVNNEYRGIYILTEKIKQDKGRVDISKLTTTDVAGDDLTGGYIFRIDTYDETNSWQSNYPPFGHLGKTVHYVYDDPSADVLVTQQKNYLKNTINSFESVLNGSGFANPSTGYPAWIKMNSMIDFFIVNEISRNMNAYRKNCYYFKNKDSNDSKIHSGPVWDFDQAFKNLDDDCTAYRATDGSGWVHRIDDCATVKTNSNGWIVRLLQDPAFVNALYSRYSLMRNSYISNSYLNNFIDSVKNLAAEAQVRHYTKWNILGADVGADEIDPQPTTYDGQVTKLKNWIQIRMAWLDNNIPGNPTGIQAIESDFNFRIFPNPARDILYLEASDKIQQIKIFRANGTCILNMEGLSDYSTQINISGYSPGLYLISLRTKGNQTVTSKVSVF